MRASLATIVLAGGRSSRLGKPKALLSLAGKPLIQHVVGRAKAFSKEVLVCVKSLDQLNIPLEAKLVVDGIELNSPLAGVLAGALAAKEEFVFLTACDTPFISRSVVEKLLEKVMEKEHFNAAIPRWPNGFIEPLYAVYKRMALVKAVEEVLSEGSEPSLRNVISRLNPLFIPVEELKVDPRVFLNINSLRDLRVAEEVLVELEDKLV